MWGAYMLVALDANLRLLQARVHNKNNAIELCHRTSDLIDAGTRIGRDRLF